MYQLKRSIRRHAVACAGLLCLLLVVASTSRCTGDSIMGGDPGPELPGPENPGPTDPDPMGTMQGSVTSDGSPLPAVEVWISSPVTRSRSAITDAEGAFNFTLLPGGPYIVRLADGTSPANVCESVSAMVAAEQSVTVQILCQPIGILKGLVQWRDGLIISDLSVQVSLSGPVSRESQTANGRFGFSPLPAGVYTVTPAIPGILCAPVTLTVALGQVTNADISCEIPTFAEIQGEWTFSIAQLSPWDYGPATHQTGTCPPLLAFPAKGSIAFDVAANTVSIVGLVPDLTMVAELDPAICAGTSCFRNFHGRAGTGLTVRPDGSFIRSNLGGSFFFSIIDGGLSIQFGLEREHRLADDELVCSEYYLLEGTNT